MMQSRVTILTSAGVFAVADAAVEGPNIWLSKAALREATGFELKPEGLCRDDLCYPLPRGREAEFGRGGLLNLATFWRYRQGAIVSSESGDVWSLAEPAAHRAGQLMSLQAPDFSLPDADGQTHSLSDFRGKKVLLAAWASW